MFFNQPVWTTSEFGSSTRKRSAKIIITLVFLVFAFRLIQLQVFEYSQYSEKSDVQVIKKIRTTPVRGNMYDRNGVLIVNNTPSFSVTITPYEFRDEVMPLLSKILNIDSSEIRAILKKYNTFSRFTPIKILRDVDFSVISKIEEYSNYLPGVEVYIDTKRTYDFNCNMAHALGFTREITQEQLARHQYYKPGDMIGQNGLEQSYENILRGRDGIKFIFVDKMGHKVAAFADGEKDIMASNGFALNLTIDIKLQGFAERLLAGRRGAIVAIDPNNGEVIACASKPDYDPRLFTGKVPANIYNALNSDKSFPLLPRALQSQYPPGSTWKMLIALAALQEGIINENTTLHCDGGFTLAERTWKCHGAHGNISIRNALKTSCNSFFCTLAVRLEMDRFVRYGTMFNFGQKTHIDLPFERSGRLPSKEWLLKRDKYLRSFKGRLANFGLGQGEILVTPLQMAAYTAAIANGGTYYQPHLVKSALNQITGKTDDLHFDYKKIPIAKKHFNTVKDGMWLVVNAGGTGSSAAITGLNVCGKTGTAQNPHGLDHSWFVCFAPKDNPKIALCVFVENAGTGAAVAVPIATRMLQRFFYLRSLTTSPNIENVENNLPLFEIEFDDEDYDL